MIARHAPERAADAAAQRGSGDVGPASRTEDDPPTRSRRTTSRHGTTRSSAPSEATAAPREGMSAEPPGRVGNRRRSVVSTEELEQLSLDAFE